jgi:hypothetical protein
MREEILVFAYIVKLGSGDLVAATLPYPNIWTNFTNLSNVARIFGVPVHRPLFLMQNERHEYLNSSNL